MSRLQVDETSTTLLSKTVKNLSEASLKSIGRETQFSWIGQSSKVLRFKNRLLHLSIIKVIRNDFNERQRAYTLPKQ